tara:strand:- start:287 stop:565 length:279 start_codon:yes stop_codon:yes gene_type:complete
MNIKYFDENSKFYFICEACGEPIEDLDGVVDFPNGLSKNIKSPLRFYCRGRCASYGNLRRSNDYWGCMNLKDFLDNLKTGKQPYTKILKKIK